MTATEQITAEDLALLAERVMGWRRVDQFQTTQNGDFYVYLHEDTVRVLKDKVIEFDPTRDTAEGLWQAKQLREAWRAQRQGRECTVRQRVEDGYSVILHDWSLLDGLGESWCGVAETESLAIVRAVLAAVKAETHQPAV